MRGGDKISSHAHADDIHSPAAGATKNAARSRSRDARECRHTSPIPLQHRPPWAARVTYTSAPNCRQQLHRGHPKAAGRSVNQTRSARWTVELPAELRGRQIGQRNRWPRPQTTFRWTLRNKLRQRHPARAKARAQVQAPSQPQSTSHPRRPLYTTPANANPMPRWTQL